MNFLMSSYGRRKRAPATVDNAVLQIAEKKAEEEAAAAKKAEEEAAAKKKAEEEAAAKKKAEEEAAAK